MNKKCSQCGLVNFAADRACLRCDSALKAGNADSSQKRSTASRLLVRAGAVMMTCILVITGFYLSLVVSAKRLTRDEKATVKRAIDVLREKGFDQEAMILSSFTTFRASDNWLNASVAKENAYAATNFPFEIMTLYADFFTYPADDVEKAAILLHEARHLTGEGEKDAYAFVWKYRHQLGWTEDKYIASPVWLNVRDQTRDQVPELFNCADKRMGDCTDR
jgi:hypothetical protein